MILSNLKELNEYIPNCVVCQKPLHLTYSWSFEYSGRRNLSSAGRIIVDDNLWQFKGKQYSMMMDPVTNKFTTELELAKTVQYSNATIEKRCSTCDFKLDFRPEEKPEDSTQDLGPYSLFFGNLNFTLTGNRRIQISVHRNWEKENQLYGRFCVNQKYLKNIVLFDFAQMSSFDKLKNRIDTILMFY